MTASNFDRALSLVLQYEGGFTDDRRDPGNWTGGKVGAGQLNGTKKGIAAASFPHLDIKNLTDAQIAEIYRAKYWNRVRGDELPSGIDLSTMDGGVNSGPARSVRWLQAALGESLWWRWLQHRWAWVCHLPVRRINGGNHQIRRHIWRRYWADTLRQSYLCRR